MKLGFIGLGNMGAPMASNLGQAGFEVGGYDIVASPPVNVMSCATPEDAVSGKDIVLTMLPDGEALTEVAGDVLPVMKSGSTLVDCSTVEHDVALSVAKQAKARGIEFLDAPVSGGSVGAQNGTLTFMVGGTLEAFAMVKHLFEIMGKMVIHCGPSGSGQIAKVCNNMILGTTMIVTCEAYGLAKKLGLDLGVLYDVVSQSSGFSWSNNVYCPVPGVGPLSPADKDYKPGFATSLMLKDLKLSQSAARSAGCTTEMGAQALQYYQNMADSGYSDMDFSAVMLHVLKNLD